MCVVNKMVVFFVAYLQSDQAGEALEDVFVQAADAVVGQVSERHKMYVSGLCL